MIQILRRRSCAVRYRSRQRSEQRSEVLRRLGLAEAALRDRGAFAHLEAAIEASADPVVRAGIALELSRALRVAAEFPRAVGPLERALEALPPSSPLAERVEAELINVSLFDPGVAPRASARLRRFRDRGRSGTP